MMKLLFINLPYYGHVVPTIGLVQELIAQGCEVTYMLPYDWEDKIKASGAVFCGYNNHKQLAEQMKHAYASAEKIISQFDGIIYEQFFFLGKHLAEKYHKPAVRVFTAPVTNKVLMERFIEKGPLSIFKCKWINKAFTKDIAKDISMKTDNWLDEIVYNPAGLNLIYTLKEYQPYIEDFSNDLFKFLGPSIYDRNEEFLFVKTRPIIYISLGTIVKGAKVFFKQCIEDFKNEDVDVILSCGNFDIRKLKSVPSNIHIYTRVPQIEVLKIADVFVTHGGMNSVSEALVYGVPMVVIPFASDQFVNAECVEKLGVGKKLDDMHALKSLVSSVMMDTGMKESMNRVQDMIHDALGNSGGAKLIIEYIKKAF